MPPELEGRSFLGMSLLYHLTHFLSVAFPGRLTQFPHSPISEIATVAAEVCGWRWETVVERLDGRDPNTPTDRLPGRCFDGALVEALLSDNQGDDNRGGGGGGGARSRGDKGDGGGNGGGGGEHARSTSGFGFPRDSTLISFVVRREVIPGTQQGFVFLFFLFFLFISPP